MKIGEWFLQRKDLIKLQCEVFEDNKVSQAFISSLGFKIVGEMYLDQKKVVNMVNMPQYYCLGQGLTIARSVH